MDYVVYTDGDQGSSSKTLVHGYFHKPVDEGWVFSDSLSFPCSDLAKFCTGICRAPAKAKAIEHPCDLPAVESKRTIFGKRYTLGNSPGRFPSISIGDDTLYRVAWEAAGDIMVALDRPGGVPLQFAVEHDQSDSYDPQLLADGNNTWVFYLNNRDGFYRLYGKRFDGKQLSDELLFSAKEPADAMTPAVVKIAENDFILAWSVWKANFRYLFRREIKDGIMDSIRLIKTMPSKDLEGYTNAWYPTLAAGTDKRVWGAWNQHYPATLGVCAGDLTSLVTSVTRLAEKMDDSENGGYPSILVDEKNCPWVFTESFAWDMLADKAQQINAYRYDATTKQWTLPEKISVDTLTFYNQTPTAVRDRNGLLWVAWSARKRGDHGTWGIYISRQDGSSWAIPRLISDPSVCSRAPHLAAGGKNGLWVVYHEGTGNNMKIGLQQLDPSRLSTIN